MNGWNSLEKPLDPFEHRNRPLFRGSIRQLRDNDEVPLIFLGQKTFRQLLEKTDRSHQQEDEDRHDTNRPHEQRARRAGIALLCPAE